MPHPVPELDFLAIGELLVDFSQTGPGPQGFPQYEALPGGAPANVAAALAKWGLSSGFIGNVGGDALGALLAGTLAGAGVDCSRLLPSPEPTSLAMVSLAQGGERSFAFYWKDTSCAVLDPRLADPATCRGGRIFHSGSVSLSTPQSRQVTLDAVRAAKAGGSTISFDANLRPGLWSWQPGQAREPIAQALALADIVKLSEEELYFMAGATPGTDAIHRDDPRNGRLMQDLLRRSGAGLLFVTFGREGCRWLGPAGEGALDTLPVQPVDTTGAGDCFMAGVLHQFLLLDKPVEQLQAADYLAMARRGVTCGALSTERRGGIPSIPTPQEITARLQGA
jgi:sugar/nucleoside kinase (ribokinase family)